MILVTYVKCLPDGSEHPHTVIELPKKFSAQHGGLIACHTHTKGHHQRTIAAGSHNQYERTKKKGMKDIIGKCGSVVEPHTCTEV